MQPRNQLDQIYKFLVIIALVIFGASGDLTQRKLVPALFDLFAEQEKLLSPNFAVIGFSRSPISDDEFRASARAGVERFSRHAPISEHVWLEFSSALHYQSGQFDDPASYRQLAERLAHIDGDHRTLNGVPGLVFDLPGDIDVLRLRKTEAQQRKT